MTGGSSRQSRPWRQPCRQMPCSSPVRTPTPIPSGRPQSPPPIPRFAASGRSWMSRERHPRPSSSDAGAAFRLLPCRGSSSTFARTRRRPASGGDSLGGMAARCPPPRRCDRRVVGTALFMWANPVQDGGCGPEDRYGYGGARYRAAVSDLRRAYGSVQWPGSSDRRARVGVAPGAEAVLLIDDDQAE